MSEATVVQGPRNPPRPLKEIERAVQGTDKELSALAAERARLQASLGERWVMLLRNHGTLVCGRSIAEAWDLMYYLERACQAQVSLLTLGEPLVEVPEAVAEQVAGVFESPSRAAPAKIWPAMLRMLDRIDPSYRG